MADISSEKLRKKIKEILRDADLSTLSAKKVRLKLQTLFDTDLAERKKEIDKMTMTLIMEMEEKGKESEGGEEDEEEEQNGKTKSESEEEPEKEPPKKKAKSKASSKKKKRKTSEEDEEELAPLENDDLNVYDEEQKTLKMSDEELAKRLQSFEDMGRRTRGRGVTPKKQKEKKKSGGGGGTGYCKPFPLSPDLAALMGTEELARNQVVKKMWEIVKERKLQDPKDKRFMICDEQLLKVFGRKRVKTFDMMKYLSPHIGSDSHTLESVITNSDIYDDEADDD